MRRIIENPVDFQLKITSDCITPRSGLIIFFETARAMGLTERIKELFPQPGSNRGIKAHDYVMTLLLMLLGGGRFLEDIRQIKTDAGLCRLCGIKTVPSADAIAQWLREEDNLERVKKMVEYLNLEILRRSNLKEFTLDTDATWMETVKGEAPMTYKGFRGYSCLLSFLCDIDLCVMDEYREGNVHAGDRVKEQLIYTAELLKGLNKILKYFRSDSAGYTSFVINECFERGIVFTITADQDSAVKSAIKAIPESEWKPLYDKEGVLTQRQYATTLHTMNNSQEAFTLVAQRWEDKQPSLFDEFKYNYYVIATNDFVREPQDIIYFHNARGNAENYNKELKLGFNLEYTPTSALRANALYFKLGVLAYNLSVAVKRFVLQGNWIKKTINTLRWQLIHIAGKVVSHSRFLVLKVSRSAFEFLSALRHAIPSLAFLSSA